MQEGRKLFPLLHNVKLLKASLARRTKFFSFFEVLEIEKSFCKKTIYDLNRAQALVKLFRLSKYLNNYKRLIIYDEHAWTIRGEMEITC